MRALTRRLAALEENAGVGEGFLVIMVTSGFHRGENATSGNREWMPMDGETVEQFRRRSEGEAREAGLKFITFGN
jgi:hypothetical protein